MEVLATLHVALSVQQELDDFRVAAVPQLGDIEAQVDINATDVLCFLIGAAFVLNGCPD